MSGPAVILFLILHRCCHGGKDNKLGQLKINSHMIIILEFELTSKKFQYAKHVGLACLFTQDPYTYGIGHGYQLVFVHMKDQTSLLQPDFFFSVNNATVACVATVALINHNYEMHQETAETIKLLKENKFPQIQVVNCLTILVELIQH